MRMAHTFTMQHYKTAANKRALSNFTSRLHWQGHFMQKFEDESRMEFEPVNKAYQGLEKDRDEHLIKAWQEGKTGVPLVDACMRYLAATGWLNFRMRAMVASFLTYLLWQPWQPGAEWFQRCLIDFDTGINHQQWQMQAGTVGWHANPARSRHRRRTRLVATRS